MHENGQYKFRTIVSEVAFFVGYPVHGNFIGTCRVKKAIVARVKSQGS